MSIHRAALVMMGQQHVSRQGTQKGRTREVLSRPFLLYQPLKQPHEQHVTASRLASSTRSTHIDVIRARMSVGGKSLALETFTHPANNLLPDIKFPCIEVTMNLTLIPSKEQAGIYPNHLPPCVSYLRDQPSRYCPQSLLVRPGSSQVGSNLHHSGSCRGCYTHHVQNTHRGSSLWVSGSPDIAGLRTSVC